MAVVITRQLCCVTLWFSSFFLSTLKECINGRKSQFSSQTLVCLCKTNWQYFCQIVIDVESGGTNFYVEVILKNNLYYMRFLKYVIYGGAYNLTKACHAVLINNTYGNFSRPPSGNLFRYDGLSYTLLQLRHMIDGSVYGFPYLLAKGSKY